MPWKTKKMRKIGPFWFESSKVSETSQLRRVGHRRPAPLLPSRPLFGTTTAAPAPATSTPAAAGEGVGH
ncbi:MAG: hypothetical protein U0Q22_01525 [Acidimicrobiales bacterium]